MADIPDVAWMIIGGFVALVSVFLGFLRPVTYNAFFQLMVFVGIGMGIYGFIKMKINQKTLVQGMEDRRLQRAQGEKEVDIDIDDYRNNPALRNQVMQKGYPSQYSNSSNNLNPTYSNQTGGASYNGTPRTPPSQQQNRQQNPYPSTNTQSANRQVSQQGYQTSQQHAQQRSPSNTHSPVHRQQSGHNAPMHSARTHPASQGSFCSSCGTPLLKHQKYCPICGTRT